MGKVKINWKKVLGVIGLSATLMTLSSCGKKAECNVSSYHLHRYENPKGYVRYIDQEWMDYEGYERQEEYIEVDENQKALQRYLDDRNLLKIEDNINTIQEQQKNNKDFIEYRYSYTYLMPIPHITRVGKVTTTYFTYMPTRHYSWTTDPNHSRLTGEQRLCHYVYTSYKIEKDEYGKYVLIPAPEGSDIIESRNEYPYIKENYYTIVNSDGNELNYEDMETDNKEHIREDDETLDDTKEQGKTLTMKKTL